MERAAAIRKLGKLLGKSLAYRVNPKAASADEREQASQELKQALLERKVIEAEKTERYQAILRGDAEYQRLKVAHKAACERVDELSGITRAFKFTVGTTNSMFFHVKAEGDSWEEVIRKVEAQK